MKSMGSILGKSPLQGVKSHIDRCLQCAEALKAVLTPEVEPRAAAMKIVRDLEKDADTIKAEIRHQLSRRLFLPVPKQLILDLVRRQDKIANRAKDVASLFTHRFGPLPPEIIEILHAHLEASLDVAREARLAIDELDNLVTTGFRGVEADRVQEMIDQVDRLEGRSDQRQWELFAKLRAVEELIAPLDAVFVYRITTLINEIGDHADHAGRLLATTLDT